ncbi:MAG TPA: hypothetical protein VJ996_00560, partial [Solirubrobacteraceae bacterium]|nr:hypothetical protein [Solirubrobacteraceae bacterium]
MNTLTRMRLHSTHIRDASLRRLARVNRWLIAGSVALAALLTEVAAQAFPGRSRTTSTAPAAAKVKAASAHSATHASETTTNPGSLQPPAQAPQAATQGGGESSSTPQSSAEATHESAPSRESAP